MEMLSMGSLPAGWGKKVSQRTGKVYYVNLFTSESTYHLPEHPAQAPPAESADTHDVDDGDVMAVVCGEDERPGSVMLAQTPSGDTFEVTVPDGVRPGEEFHIMVPSTVRASSSQAAQVPAHAPAPRAASGSAKLQEEVQDVQRQLLQLQMQLASPGSGEAAIDGAESEEQGFEEEGELQGEMVAVTCSEGHGPGSSMIVGAVDDSGAVNHFEVTVPDDVEPGDEFYVSMPKVQMQEQEQEQEQEDMEQAGQSWREPGEEDQPPALPAEDGQDTQVEELPPALPVEGAQPQPQEQRPVKRVVGTLIQRPKLAELPQQPLPEPPLLPAQQRQESQAEMGGGDASKEKEYEGESTGGLSRATGATVPYGYGTEEFSQATGTAPSQASSVGSSGHYSGGQYERWEEDEQGTEEAQTVETESESAFDWVQSHQERVSVLAAEAALAQRQNSSMLEARHQQHAQRQAEEAADAAASHVDEKRRLLLLEQQLLQRQYDQLRREEEAYAAGAAAGAAAADSGDWDVDSLLSPVRRGDSRTRMLSLPSRSTSPASASVQAQQPQGGHMDGGVPAAPEPEEEAQEEGRGARSSSSGRRRHKKRSGSQSPSRRSGGRSRSGSTERAHSVGHSRSSRPAASTAAAGAGGGGGGEEEEREEATSRHRARTPPRRRAASSADAASLPSSSGRRTSTPIHDASQSSRGGSGRDSGRGDGGEAPSPSSPPRSSAASFSRGKSSSARRRSSSRSKSARRRQAAAGAAAAGGSTAVAAAVAAAPRATSPSPLSPQPAWGSFFAQQQAWAQAQAEAKARERRRPGVMTGNMRPVLGAGGGSHSRSTTDGVRTSVRGGGALHHSGQWTADEVLVAKTMKRLFDALPSSKQAAREAFARLHPQHTRSSFEVAADQRPMSLAELKRGLGSMGVRDLDDKQLELVMRELDQDGDGTVSFAEFIDALWRHKLDALKLKLAGAATYGRTTASSAPRRGTAAGAGQHGGEEEGEEASVVDWVALFRRYDRNSDGNLSFDEFRLAVRKDARIPPAQMDDSELREVFDHVDSSGDGTIDIAEFVGLMYDSSFTPAHIRKQHLAALGCGTGSPLRQQADVSRALSPSASAAVNARRAERVLKNPPTVNSTMVQRRIDAAKAAGMRKREAAEAARQAVRLEREGRNSDQAYVAYAAETQRRASSPPTARVQRTVAAARMRSIDLEELADRELRATNERTQAWLEQEESGGVWRRWNAMPATDLRRQCAQRGLPATGRKPELVARLRLYEARAHSDRDGGAADGEPLEVEPQLLSALADAARAEQERSQAEKQRPWISVQAQERREELAKRHAAREAARQEQQQLEQGSSSKVAPTQQSEHSQSQSTDARSTTTTACSRRTAPKLTRAAAQGRLRLSEQMRRLDALQESVGNSSASSIVDWRHEPTAVATRLLNTPRGTKPSDSPSKLLMYQFAAETLLHTRSNASTESGTADLWLERVSAHTPNNSASSSYRKQASGSGGSVQQQEPEEIRRTVLEAARRQEERERTQSWLATRGGAR